MKPSWFYPKHWFKYDTNWKQKYNATDRFNVLSTEILCVYFLAIEPKKTLAWQMIEYIWKILLGFVGGGNGFFCKYLFP
jgi:hypothetical protein